MKSLSKRVKRSGSVQTWNGVSHFGRKKCGVNIYWRDKKIWARNQDGARTKPGKAGDATPGTEFDGMQMPHRSCLYLPNYWFLRGGFGLGNYSPVWEKVPGPCLLHKPHLFQLAHSAVTLPSSDNTEWLVAGVIGPHSRACMHRIAQPKWQNKWLRHRKFATIQVDNLGKVRKQGTFAPVYVLRCFRPQYEGNDQIKLKSSLFLKIIRNKKL